MFQGVWFFVHFNMEPRSRTLKLRRVRRLIGEPHPLGDATSEFCDNTLPWNRLRASGVQPGNPYCVLRRFAHHHDTGKRQDAPFWLNLQNWHGRYQSRRSLARGCRFGAVPADQRAAGIVGSQVCAETTWGDFANRDFVYRKLYKSVKAAAGRRTAAICKNIGKLAGKTRCGNGVCVGRRDDVRNPGCIHRW